MNYWGKTYSTQEDLVVAICDDNLIDKEIVDKEIKIKVSRGFYGGMYITEGIALKLLNKATIGNLIGEKIVDMAEKNGFITKENIIFINGIPHAQFVKI